MRVERRAYASQSIPDPSSRQVNQEAHFLGSTSSAIRKHSSVSVMHYVMADMSKIGKCLRRWLGCGVDSPNERWLRLAAGVSKIEDQGKVSIVNGNTGDIDNAGDALLDMY
jgi:hypothetical protein